MTQIWAWLLILNYLVVPAGVVSLLRRRREPTSMLAWLMAIILLPFIGITLYWLMASPTVVRRARRKRRRIAHLLEKIEARARDAATSAGKTRKALSDDLREIAEIGAHFVQNPVVGGNSVQIYEQANPTYDAICTAIRNARHHVHAEYYIWQPDETGRLFRDLLVEKARAGVECRVLLDAVGCWRVTRKFLKPLKDAGAQVAFFQPLWPLRRRLSPHLRNHRKIVVVDGKVGFAGSQNIGDEYRGRRRKLSPWYDTHLRIEGPAVAYLQAAFAEDWLFATRENLGDAAYFAVSVSAGDSFIQILPTVPEQRVSALEQVVFAAVARARESIKIATPYFIPGPGLRMALIHASSRGVRVELVIPTHTDVWITLWAARSYYAEMIDAGIRVYEYERGVVHSKIMTVDDRWCMLGSANMDVRSFRLNFEITALVYDPAIAAKLSAYVDRFAQQAVAVTPREVYGRPVAHQVLEGTARLLAPLL